MNLTHHAELIRNNEVQTVKFDCVSEKVEKIEKYVERFGIDDARELVRQAYGRPVNSDELALVVRTELITLEAQNALLKILEEPPLSTKLVFVVPVDLMILDTLSSRFNQKKVDTEIQTTEAKEVFKVFLNADYKTRLSEIESAIKKKDVMWQRLIKQGLIGYMSKNKDTVTSIVGLEYAVRTLLTRGASNKMLLEHIALIL